MDLFGSEAYLAVDQEVVCARVNTVIAVEQESSGDELVSLSRCRMPPGTSLRRFGGEKAIGNTIIIERTKLK